MTQENDRLILDRRSTLGLGLAVSALPLAPALAESGAAESTTAVASGDARLDTLREAWSGYNRAVEDARQAIEATPRFRDRTDHRAEAYYSLAEAQAMAYNIAVAPRLDHPTINTRTWYHNVHTLGGTSSDLYHVSALVDSRHSYRLFGRVGDMKILVMQVFNTVLGGQGQKQLLNVDLAKMADANGRFEVVLSARKHAGNWIPLDTGSDLNFLFIRRFHADWFGDRGALDIELLDGPIVDDEQDPATVVRRLHNAAALLTFLVKGWNIGIYDMYLHNNNGKKNSLAIVQGSDIASDSGGSPSTIYSLGVFDFKPDEAVIVEYDKPDAAFWSLQVQSVWTKPINYIDRQSDINGRNAAIDSDGKFRAVICHQDPGVANWLDAGGHAEGTMVGRAYHARSVPAVPTVRVVKAEDVRKFLPANTAMVTPAERTAALKRRREGLLKMFGDA